MPPVNTYKQGAVGTADRVANFQPESWSPTVHKALPYNRFPMTTIMDAMAKGSGTIDSRFHHWSEEAHTPYYGTILDVYTDVLSTAYVSGGVEGTPIYIAVTAAAPVIAFAVARPSTDTPAAPKAGFPKVNVTRSVPPDVRTLMKPPFNWSTTPSQA